MRILDVVEVLGVLDFPAPLHCQCDLRNHGPHGKDCQRVLSLRRKGSAACSVRDSSTALLRSMCDASVVTANYARRTTAPQGAVHQFPVRSRCSLLVASISDGFATGAYAQQAPAALIHHSSFINGLRPRGCRLVLLRSGCEPLTFNS